MVLALSDDVVNVAAEVYANLYREGQLVSDADILIAATAMVHGLDLVTENPGHFQRIRGLRVSSWRTPM